MISATSSLINALHSGKVKRCLFFNDGVSLYCPCLKVVGLQVCVSKPDQKGGKILKEEALGAGFLSLFLYLFNLFWGDFKHCFLEMSSPLSNELNACIQSPPPPPTPNPPKTTVSRTKGDKSTTALEENQRFCQISTR